ncbi:MAG TPA: hypothetical protein VKW06_16235 [Candidatus Angelobacter sp.]|nr:hypothetical protein [Candidatus Angelobacter sp.]
MCRILSMGRDRHLMNVRSVLLRHYGHTVEEAYAADDALQLLTSKVIDLILICHSITPRDRKALMLKLKEKTRPLPVIALIAREGESYANCLNVENSPAALLEAIRSATAEPRESRTASQIPVRNTQLPGASTSSKS